MFPFARRGRDVAAHGAAPGAGGRFALGLVVLMTTSALSWALGPPRGAVPAPATGDEPAEDVRAVGAPVTPSEPGAPRGRHLPDLEPAPRVEWRWENLTLGARWGHRALYHPGRHSVIVVGGMYERALYPAAWEIPLDGTPVPRRLGPLDNIGLSPDASAVLDTRRDRLVVFAGSREGPVDCCYGYTYGTHHTTQALDLRDAGAWSVLHGGWCGMTCPVPLWRYLHVAVYDAERDRMVMFGGGQQYSNGAFPELATRFRDAWALSLSDPVTWSPLATSGEIPAMSAGGGAVLDPARDRMLYLWADRAWSLDLETMVWDSLEVGGPGPVQGATFAMDEAGRRVFASAFGSVWRLDLEGPLQWKPIAHSDPAPPGRGDVVWDPRGRRLVTFGGGTTAAARPVTAPPVVWALEPDVPAPRWQVLFDGRLPGTGTRLAAYDARRDRLLVLNAEHPARACLFELPSGGASWHRVPASELPIGGSWWTALLLDEDRDRLLAEVMDGAESRTFEWRLDGSGPWNPIASSKPGYWRLAGDPLQGTAVRAGWPFSNGAFEAHRLTADATGERWVRLPVRGEVPPLLDFSELAGDPGRGVLRLLGSPGSPYLEGEIETAWTLEPGETLRVAATRLAYPIRWYAEEGFPALAFDPLRHRWVLHGAYMGEAGWMYDMHLIDPDRGRVQTIGHTGEFEVPPRVDHALTYDGRNDRMILAGGWVRRYGDTPVTHEDAWAIAWPKPTTTVRVDVRPGAGSDVVRPGTHADLQVAVLGEPGFDVLRIAAGTVRVAGVPVRRDGGGRPMSNLRDLDGDGYVDVVFHVDSHDLPLTETGVALKLWGMTVESGRFEGVAHVAVRLPGREPRSPDPARSGTAPAHAERWSVRATGTGMSTRFVARGPAGTAGTVEVFDLAGRRVAASGPRAIADGREHELTATGSVRPGLYFARIRTLEGERRSRVVVLP